MHDASRSIEAASDRRTPSELATRRTPLFATLALILVLGFFLLLGVEWRSGAHLHTVIEAVATTLALLAGLFAVAAHTSHRTDSFLFIGTGFLVAGLLDAYHTVATSPWLEQLWLSPPASMTPWSWNVSRIFLALLVLLGWWMERRERRRTNGAPISHRALLVAVGAATAVTMATLAFLRLPPAYTDGPVGRPQDLVVGGLFVLALVLYLRREPEGHASFEDGLLLFILLSCAAQIYMAFSGTLYDTMFDVAHLLKVASYGALILGSVATVRRMYGREEVHEQEIVAARAVQESEARFRATFEHVAVGLAHVGLDGRFLRINKRFCRIVGYSREEMSDLTFQQITHPDDLDGDLANLERLLAGEIDTYTMEKRYLHKDGSPVWIELTVSLFRRADGEPGYFIAAVQDIQDRKEAEEALRESEYRYQSIFSNVPVSIWEEDWTEVIAMIRSVDADDPEEFRRYLDEHPEFVDEALQRVEILDVNEQTCEMFGADRKEQILASLETVFATDDTLPGFVGELEAIFRGDEIYRTEMSLRTVDGDLVWVLLTMNFPPPGSDSGRVLVSLMDIGDRKRAEELVQAKNRDLETLLYVISHDLREPLRAIESFSRMVRDRYAEKLDDKGSDFLERVVVGARRMDQLLEDLLQLSRAQRIEAPTDGVDGRQVIDRALGQLQAKIQRSGATIDVAPDFPLLLADERWASQAIYNLVGNALKFTHDDEPPEIEIAPWVNQDEAGIVVRDRGPGIAPEHRERVMELFQRAVGREVEGTGAGLAIVRQIAERHGGRVWIEDREGGGAEIGLTFGRPAASERQEVTSE